MSSIKGSHLFYIQSAFRKIKEASINETGIRLTKSECRAIALDSGISDANGDIEEFKFDENREPIE